MNPADIAKEAAALALAPGRAVLVKFRLDFLIGLKAGKKLVSYGHECTLSNNQNMRSNNSTYVLRSQAFFRWRFVITAQIQKPE